MTDLDLDRLRALADAAQDPPWRTLVSRMDDRFMSIVGTPTVEHVAEYVHTADAAFIAAARTAVPALIDRLTAADEEAERLRADLAAARGGDYEAVSRRTSELTVEASRLRSEARRIDAAVVEWTTRAEKAEADLAAAEDANERLQGMVEWLAEVVVDARDALTTARAEYVGGLRRPPTNVRVPVDVDALLGILDRERTAHPSRYARFRAALTDPAAVEAVAEALEVDRKMIRPPVYRTPEDRARLDAAAALRAFAAFVDEEVTPEPFREVRTTACKAGGDGECDWIACPQIRDGEPKATGRHCPRDLAAFVDEEADRG